MKLNAIRLAILILAGLAIPAAAQPRWSRDDAQELLNVVEHIAEEGLDPADYEVGSLQTALAGPDDAAARAKADAVFLHVARDFTQGHVRNRAAIAWYLPGPSLDVNAGRRLLDTALAGGGVRATLQRLLPQHRQYQALKAALATTPERDKAGIQRLRANLERWRWMPRDLGRRYLLVNVPAFTVSLIEDNKVVARRRVIVGKVATPTPQFGATVAGVILNPWWDIPPSIVRESVGRLIGTNPAQARQRGFVVSGGRYRQRPGATNALGQIKLVMPNPFNVYLHDTPNKALFDAEVRAFSHGCIRTQDPFGLAETLLAASDGWDRTRIDGIVASGKTTQVSLGQPLPIYIAYLTVAAEDSGDLATFPDIYGRDPSIVAALIDRENDTAP
jgi:murein L,D-transpeptidase YcbB/YkuD